MVMEFNDETYSIPLLASLKMPDRNKHGSTVNLKLKINCIFNVPLTLGLLNRLSGRYAKIYNI